MEKKFRFTVLMVLALAVGLTAGVANAKLIAYEPFDYPVSEILNDMNGGTGWGGPWEGESDIYGVVPQIAAGNLFAYGTGNHYKLNAAGVENYLTAERELATYLYDDGSTYWVSYEYQKANSENEFTWAGFLFGYVWFGKGYAEDYHILWDETYGFPGDDVTTADVTVLSLLVLKVETNGTEAEDHAYLWVNPPPGVTPATGTEDAYLAIPLTEDADDDDDTTVDYRLESIVFDYGSAEGEGVAAHADDFTADEFRIGTLYQDVAGQGKLATIVSPADEATNVDPNTDANQGGTELEWTAVSGATGYDVYFGTYYDPDGVYGDEDPNFPVVNTKIVNDQLVTSVDPGVDLAMGTQYYWRVDPHVGGPTYTGGIWTFTTWPTAPVVTLVTDPNVLTVPASGSASITVDSSGNLAGAHTYTWYKQVGATQNPGSDTLKQGPTGPKAGPDTYTDVAVQLADEGYYYCKVTNAAGTTYSASSRLLTKRKMAHWKLNGSLSDETGSYNATSGAPNYVSGIDGQAVQITIDPNSFIRVTDAIGPLNHITVSMWVEPNELASALFFVPQEGEPYYGDTSSVHLMAEGLTGTFNGTVTDGVEAEVDDILTVGQWNHIVFVYDTTNDVARYHVNGNLMAIDGVYEQAIDAAVLPNLLPLSMGGRNLEEPGSIFEWGLIDDVRVYNYPVSAKAIAQMYVAFAGGTPCYGPVEYDVNGNCKVWWLDIKAVADAWLECNEVYSGGAADGCLDPVIPD